MYKFLRGPHAAAEQQSDRSHTRTGEQLPGNRDAEQCRLPVLEQPRRLQSTHKHRFFFRWLKSSYLEDAQDYTFRPRPGLMDWNEKRPAYSGAVDWTYAISPTTIFNVTVDTN